MIVRQCVRCHRPVQGRWWQRWGSPPLCPPQAAESCSLIASEVDGTLAPPADQPEPDINPKPDDYWQCSCGSGEIAVSRDWETGATRVETCPRCGGTARAPW